MHPMYRLAWAALPALALAALPARAEDRKDAKRVEVGRSTGEKGTLFRREAPDKPWQVVDKDEKVYSGDLLLSAAEGVVRTANDAVQFALVGDLSEHKLLPI